MMQTTMTQMMIYLHYGIRKPTYEGKALNIIKKEPLADNGKDDKYTEDSSTEDLNKHVYITTFTNRVAYRKFRTSCNFIQYL